MGFNFRKNKNLITFIVLLVAFGLVMAYVPLFFIPNPNPIPTQEENFSSPETSANLTPPKREVKTATTTPTSTVGQNEASLPESFRGLEEESESLDELLDL